MVRTAIHPLEDLRFRQMGILNSTDVQVSLEKLLKQYEHKIPFGREKEFEFLALKRVR